MEARLAEMADARSLDARIDRMHQRDRTGALAFVIGLWVTMLFALFTMLRHYSDDKSFIYGLDIKHLDEMRSRKR